VEVGIGMGMGGCVRPVWYGMVLLVYYDWLSSSPGGVACLLSVNAVNVQIGEGSGRM
jgi:hypothetical protein